MKLKCAIVLSVLFSVILACKPEKKPVVGYGKVSFKVEHLKNGSLISTQNDPTHRNAAGNLFAFTAFRYYLSNIVLIQKDGREVPMKNYQLIDLDVSESRNFSFDKIPNGDYSGIKFLIGVDSLANATGDHTGALDPAYGMDWGWNFGYRFLLVEGKYKKNDSASLTTFTYHIGRNDNLVNIKLDNAFSVNDDERSISLAFDFDKLFSKPNIWDISQVDYNHSETTANMWEIQPLIQNISNSFSISAIK